MSCHVVNPVAELIQTLVERHCMNAGFVSRIVELNRRERAACLSCFTITLLVPRTFNAGWLRNLAHLLVRIIAASNNLQLLISFRSSIGVSRDDPGRNPSPQNGRYQKLQLAVTCRLQQHQRPAVAAVATAISALNARAPTSIKEIL